jgi:hypothetical protein
MRRVIHALMAAVVGYILSSAIVGAGSSATARWFQITSGGLPTTRFLISNVVIGFSAATIGGYLSARLAPVGARLFALALLVLMFLGAAVVLWRVSPSLHQPQGYLPLLTLLDIIGLWTGAMLERATSS